MKPRVRISKILPLFVVVTLSMVTVACDMIQAIFGDTLTPDNTSAGISVNPTDGLVTNEAGEHAAFAVVLESTPTASVTVGLSCSDITEGTVGGSQLVFTTENWNTEQTVVVTGIDDEEVDGDQPYRIITEPASSDDGSYNGIDPADVLATNVDNDSIASFSRYLSGDPISLSAFIQTVDSTNGSVSINGGDTRQPVLPFSWNWGDGVIHDGWFPQTHIYEDKSRNYVVGITSRYAEEESDLVEVVVRFIPPQLQPVSLPAEAAVTIPTSDTPLATRLYDVPDGLSWFDDSFFPEVPRTTIEYILSVASAIQMDFVNGDVFTTDGSFDQVVLRDSTFSGMYSLWFTSPVSFASGDSGFTGGIGWSSFLHEMGHNYTLNSPAGFYYGGKIDGLANAIFSETMAQIFQHATAYEIVNHASDYGLDRDLAAELYASAVDSIKLVRRSYEAYVDGGMNFESWNDPNTSDDDTFNTFMTIAYLFFVHAESSQLGYRLPAKRMMELLQVFDEDLRLQYDQANDTEAADSFRATLMATAVSHAFSEDLRDEFESLGFPISDIVFDDLNAKLAGQ